MNTPEVISQADAKARGLKRFFTNAPCANGHVAQRYVVKGKCCQCGRNSMARYRVKHREQCNGHQRAYLARLRAQRRAEEHRV